MKLTHEWFVFERDTEIGNLLLECAGCGAYGAVHDPTRKEWREAFPASDRPYRWLDDSRVTIFAMGGNWLPSVESPDARLN
jgi:hypothetical protein